MKKLALLVLAAFVFSGLASASLIPFLNPGSPTPSGPNFAYTYTTNLSGDERLDPAATNGVTCPGPGNTVITCNPAGTFFTLYDIAGFQGVQGPLPANWGFSIQLTGVTPSTFTNNGAITPVFDGPLPNVTFTYTGPVFAPHTLTPLGPFTILSSLNGVNPGGTFTSQSTFDGPTSNGLTDQVSRAISVPGPGQTTGVPEPASMLMIGGGLVCLGLVRRKLAR